MRTYKNYRYETKTLKEGYIIPCKVYRLYNERGEVESEFLDLDELKEAVDNRIKYGYWCY